MKVLRFVSFQVPRATASHGGTAPRRFNGPPGLQKHETQRFGEARRGAARSGEVSTSTAVVHRNLPVCAGARKGFGRLDLSGAAEEPEETRGELSSEAN